VAFAHNFPMREYPHAQISGCMRNPFVAALRCHALTCLQTPKGAYYRRAVVVKSFLTSSFTARTDAWSASYSLAQSDDRRPPPVCHAFSIADHVIAPTLKKFCQIRFMHIRTLKKLAWICFLKIKLNKLLIRKVKLKAYNSRTVVMY